MTQNKTVLFRTALRRFLQIADFVSKVVPLTMYREKKFNEFSIANVQDNNYLENNNYYC